MAGRGGSSNGVVAAVVLGVFAAGFFVLSLVFYGGKSSAEQELKKYRDESKEIVRDNERNAPDLRALVAEAGKANKSLATFLREQQQSIAERITGNRADGPAQLLRAADAAIGPDGGSLINRLTSTRTELASAQRSAADADAARKNAEARLTETDGRIKAMEESMKKAVAGVNTDVGAMKTQTEGYRTDVARTIDGYKTQVETIQRNADTEKVGLTNRIASLEQEKQVLEAKLRELQASRGTGLRPTDEFALVDARVIATDPADARAVFIDRGSVNKLVLGMTFEVYSDAAEIVPDETTGEYRQGKAAVEVIRIDQDQALARVVRPRGRSVDIRKGDLLVNAVYDPNKTYNFVVFGNFDTQGVGNATPQGASDVKTLITGWGGKVLDEIRGDIDFVVLGSRPVVPPQPPPDAPIASITEFLRLNREAQRYDEIFKQAASTSLPVLNQNRLFTLIGR
jgi:hypothetical protein